ncbi:MAG: M23 family metallopeptidase [Desulfobacterota bacterium]|nr:M23 family metallopeptidase [Thermodesulfobacteriota bacterium]
MRNQDISCDPLAKGAIERSPFTACLIRENGLDALGFKRWFFYPGMLFRATEKWWGDRGRRQRPHEGIDLCLFTDREGSLHALRENTKIPVLYDGIVVKVMDDFIGRTVVVEHHGFRTDRLRWITLYGHTIPSPSLKVGQILRAGEPIATLAPTDPRRGLPPHLHLSTLWIEPEISYPQLDWDSMGDLRGLAWTDPLPLI